MQVSFRFFFFLMCSGFQPKPWQFQLPCWGRKSGGKRLKTPGPCSNVVAPSPSLLIVVVHTPVSNHFFFFFAPGGWWRGWEFRSPHLLQVVCTVEHGKVDFNWDLEADCLTGFFVFVFETTTPNQFYLLPIPKMIVIHNFLTLVLASLKWWCVILKELVRSPGMHLETPGDARCDALKVSCQVPSQNHHMLAETVPTHTHTGFVSWPKNLVGWSPTQECHPNHQRWHAKIRLSRNTYTLHTRLCTFRADLYAQLVLIN